MFYDPRSQSHGLTRDPWLALVAPRPIAWISSVSPQGVFNLAPYSCFNAISGSPPFVMFSSTPRKDSLTNIAASQEFVVNLVGADLAQQMNQSSAAFPADIDEFQAVGLEAAGCHNIGAPRVARAPAALECVVERSFRLTEETGAPTQTTVVVGRVVGIHIDERILTDGMVDVSKQRPLCRLGYMNYAAVETVFEMFRPELSKI
jgi:flavin reductase (DIM6/NTAB) family NADH-FMN oxidoreductase RutF